MRQNISAFTNTSAELTLDIGYSLGLQPGSNRFVTGIDGWFKPAAMRRKKVERLNSHGTFAERGWKDERVPSISGHFAAETRLEAAQFVDEIAAFLADGSGGVLRVSDPDLGTRYARVYLMEPDVKWNGDRDVAFSLDFVAPDPRKYGDPVSVSSGVPRDGGGLRWDAFTGADSGVAGIFDFGEVGDPGTVSFYNEGTADVAATFKVTGFAPGFSLTEVASGRELVYSGTVPSGQFVTLDPNTGSVFLNGDPHADRSELLTVRQWTRTLGKTTSVFQFQSDGPNARVTLEGSPAWW